MKQIDKIQGVVDTLIDIQADNSRDIQVLKERLANEENRLLFFKSHVEKMLNDHGTRIRDADTTSYENQKDLHKLYRELWEHCHTQDAHSQMILPKTMVGDRKQQRKK